MLVGRSCFLVVESPKTMTSMWMGRHWLEPMFWAVWVCLQSFHAERRAAGCEQGAAAGVWLECGVSASKIGNFSTCPLIREPETKSKRVFGQNNLKLFLNYLKRFLSDEEVPTALMGCAILALPFLCLCSCLGSTGAGTKDGEGLNCLQMSMKLLFVCEF